MYTFMMKYPTGMGIFFASKEIIGHRQNMYDYRKVRTRFARMYGHIVRGFSCMYWVESLGMVSMCLGCLHGLGYRINVSGMVFVKL